MSDPGEDRFGLDEFGLDEFSLGRFVEAQDDGRTYDHALAELRNGRKTSHWMWFVFPQLTGLGRSGMAQRYAISSLEEAQAYLSHPVLGPRLLDCAQALTALDSSDPVRILGGIDAMKLHSSMTLFTRADPGQQLFTAVLHQYFNHTLDDATQQLLPAPRE